MITTNRIPLAAYLAFFIALTGLVFLATYRPAHGEVNSQKCVTSTITAVPIGHQASTQVLATSSNRTFARIQQVRDAAGVATTTPSVSFDEDVAATVNNGLQLSTSSPHIDFGLNTDFPYTGAVQVITNTSSTTLRVTECTY